MRKTLFASAAVLGLALATPALAQNMTPEQYLGQALRAVQDHHRMTALMAVNSAENEILSSRATTESNSTRDESAADPPVIHQTARAREAIEQRNWQQAETYLRAAMSHPSASTSGNGAAGSTGTVGSQ